MLHEWLQSSRYTVVFTGAGMSTESGLPDFRSRNKGLWNNLDPARLASTEALNKHVDEFIQFYRSRVNAVNEYKPHKGHEILAELEKDGKVKAIITQNVDGFHQEAGSANVAELHGTLQKLHCQNCGKPYGKEAYMEERYTCDCGGTVRPSVVLFGERLPEEAFRYALEETEKCDLFIVLGSSLTVTPANQFPLIAKENGAKLVIINQEETELDAHADLTIHGRKIGEVLTEVQQAMDK
jgi:NAD-dependent deacetylase